MTLNEITYQILEDLRAGHISDDERISLRYIEALVKQYREIYIKDQTKTSGGLPEMFKQDAVFPLTKNGDRADTTNKIPQIIVNRFGPMIEEVYSATDSEFPFTIVNSTALRYSGNGKFNKGLIYVAYDNNKLYTQSRNTEYANMTQIAIAAVFAEPEDVPGFSKDDEYPVDLSCISFIKSNIYSNEAKAILADRSDEKNNATGDINNG